MHKKAAAVLIGVSSAGLVIAVAACGAGRPASRARAKNTAAAQLTATSPTTTSSSAGATITADGVGVVSGTPDTMTVSIDVSTSAAHATTALDQNNSLASAVQQALERDGVAGSDIQTSGLSLQQNYPPDATGYEADDTVSATVHGLARAGTIVDDAVAAGGDASRLDGVSFSISDTSPLLTAARGQAVTAARLQAQQLAAAAGETLGPLVSLTETPEEDNTTPVAFAASSASAAPVPVRAGTQQLNVDVTGVWRAVP